MTISNELNIIICFSLLSLFIFPSIETQFSPRDLHSSPSYDNSWTFTSHTPASRGNPLRGFFPYVGEMSASDSSSRIGVTTLKPSLEYRYVALKDVNPAEGTFNWTEIENTLTTVESHQRQLVFRLYVDYPNCCPDGTYNTGVPDYLLSGTDPVTFFDYDDYGGGRSPDYTNTRLLNAMKDTISAMGEKYDGDQRIAFIQLGLIGFWGEWHTYPYDGYDQSPNLMPSLSIMNDILNEFNTAFQTTPLIVSADQLQYWTSVSETVINDTAIGWHDDNFNVATYSTSNPQNWYFYPRMKDRDVDHRWERVSIGGEVQPAIQEQLFNPSSSCSQCQGFSACVDVTHASWLLYNHLFTDGVSSEQVNNAAVASDSLGYQLHLDSIDLTFLDCPSDDCQAELSVNVKNIGSAPFPYPNFDLIVKVIQNSISSSIPITQVKEFLTADVSSLLPQEQSTQFKSTMDFTSFTHVSNSESETYLQISLQSDHILEQQVIYFATDVEQNDNGYIELKFDVPENSNSSSSSSSNSFESSSSSSSSFSSSFESSSSSFSSSSQETSTSSSNPIVEPSSESVSESSESSSLSINSSSNSSSLSISNSSTNDDKDDSNNSSKDSSPNLIFMLLIFFTLLFSILY